MDNLISAFLPPGGQVGGTIALIDTKQPNLAAESESIRAATAKQRPPPPSGSIAAGIGDHRASDPPGVGVFNLKVDESIPGLEQRLHIADGGVGEVVPPGLVVQIMMFVRMGR